MEEIKEVKESSPISEIIKVPGKLPESDIDYSVYNTVAQLMDTGVVNQRLILKSDSSQDIEMIRGSINEG